MHLAEIRDLDGPNLFMLCPAIKVELVLDDGESERDIAGRLATPPTDLLDASRSFISKICRAHQAPEPVVVVRQMDDPANVSIAFSWHRRGFAMAIAQSMADRILGVVDDNAIVHLALSLQRTDPDDLPTLIADRDRSALAIAVTGTNGKTTTTRLMAHIMRSAGFRTGWNSSSGIYIEGELIEAGDYSGPSGARRILEDSSVQAAVLETARGGILLRGLGYEHNDVSVFTNVSADHLDLQGVRTLETLAEVKSVVCRVTRRAGRVVVNADDLLVMSSTAGVAAPRVLVTQRSDNADVLDHLGRGGEAIIADLDEIVVRNGPDVVAVFALSEIPLTHGGKARHMVENAMCAIGAAIGAGVGVAVLRQSLRTFQNDSVLNPGRLNVYKFDDRSVVLDFAHNEAGLKHLIEFGKHDLGPDGRLITIIGTAGDRTDESLRELGRLAAKTSDIVIAKGTTHYLRGRTLENLMALYREGAAEHSSTRYLESESEVTAFEDALAESGVGDVIVIMAQEHLPELIARLERLMD